MASIVTRNNSFAVVYLTTVDGVRKQKWETYHTLEDAKRRKEQLELCRTLQQSRRQDKKVETVAHLMEVYLRLYGIPRWSPSTYESNLGLIRHYILPCLGNMRLSELSPRVVAALYSRMMAEPRISTQFHKQDGRLLAPYTLHRIHKVLHSAFEQAILWEYVARNPFRRAPLPAYRETQKEFLTPEQIQQLLPHCPLTLALAIHLTFAASLRKGELLALTWQDVDFTQRTLSVSKTLARISREAITPVNRREILHCFPSMGGQHRTVLVFKQPKTPSSIRTIYLPSYLVTLLQHCRPNLLAAETPPAPHLIFSYPDGRPMQEHTLTKQFHLALKEAKLPAVTFHSLRYSSISYKLALSGGDIKAVQRDSGHAQADMITDLYGQALDQNRRSLAERFDADFGSASSATYQ